MHPLTPAYAAGLIDGEGCVLIQESKGPTYHHLVTIGMTEKALAVLRAMQRQYGGALKCARPATEKWDAAYAWTVAGDAATTLLTDTSPYLILKAEQARIALKVAQIRADLPARWERSPNGQRLWTDEARTRCAALKRRMHELNAKGPARESSTLPPESARPIAHRVAGEWVELQADLFSDLGWAPFCGPWPTSGMSRGSTLYALPTWAQRTDGSASSSSRCLPTPTTKDYKDSQVRREPHRPDDTDTLSRALADLL